MRLFLAVELAPAARERLDALLAGLQRALGDAASSLRWTPAANVHVTLHFLGEREAPGLDRLRLELGASLPQPCFTVRTTAPGVFPHAGPPRVMWLGLGSGAPELVNLHDELAHRVQRAGIATEGRTFSPHLTLARVRDLDRRAARGLRAQIASVACDPIGWRVDHVTLFRSDLSGQVPRYTAIETLSLVQTEH